MTVTISLPHQTDYTIFIQSLQRIELSTKVVIVTNPTVEKLHLEYVRSFIHANEVSLCCVPDGEEYKTMQTIDLILNHCFEHRLDRSSILVALGGGVIGDMTGFAASIYQRGIEFIQIPTTLLAQVDASVGGKTGVNNAFGKNLIGSFLQPRAVYIDTYLLTTLPRREFSAGVAEIIKMAVTFDQKFFNWLHVNTLLDNNDAIEYAIEQSVQIKSKVVSLDEKEKGIRAALNYGHTFGHVIERQTGYTQYLHGEAVGIGMVMANALSVEVGLMSQEQAHDVMSLLQRYDIPTSYGISNIEAFYDDFFLDKKSIQNRIKFILPKGIGDYEIRGDIPKERVMNVLKGFLA